MISRRLLLERFAGLLATTAVPVFVVPAAAETRTVRLLTVGNSFSGNATAFLGDLARADGNVLVHHTVSIGGGSLAQHWEKVEQYERDPNDPKARYTSGRTLHDELLAEPWDFVTIQQASILSHDRTTYHPYAERLFAYIHRLSPKAEILIHQTWEYRRDDSQFAHPERAAKVQPGTQKAMYEELTAAYEALSKELGGLHIIPVGDAFHKANTDPVWGFQPDTRFDLKTATYPALPDQRHSLNRGWYWDKSGPAPVLKMDGHHASTAGQYLAACAFYEVLFGKSAVGNGFIPKGLASTDASFLQQTAHEAVLARSVKGVHS